MVSVAELIGMKIQYYIPCHNCVYNSNTGCRCCEPFFILLGCIYIMWCRMLHSSMTGKGRFKFLLKFIKTEIQDFHLNLCLINI